MSSNELERSLSTQIEESINENARSLFKRFQNTLNTPNTPNKQDRREAQDESTPGTEINEIDSCDQNDAPGDGLRLRPVRGASNLESVNREEDSKIMNANINQNNDNEKTKVNENVLNCFAEYKAEKEVC